MGKIVGNIYKIMACILLFSTTIYADVTLRAVDMEGHTLEQAGVGQPFMLEVSIAEMGKGLAEPDIKGDTNIRIQRTGLFMSTVNGVSTTKYNYRVRIDAPGTFQLGPAVVMYQGKPVESNVLTISVAQQQKSKSNEQSKTFLELKVDKDQVVVGQKINCTLTFYYTTDGISLKDIGQPAMEGFREINQQKPTFGTEKKDGELYKYVRWQWELYPQTSGKLVIPAHRADYEVEIKKRPQGFGAFSFFFGNNVEHKRVYSNAEQIHVDQLPPYDGQVDAIGDFKSIRAYIHPALAKQGEAMVLTLELEGDGDLHSIQPPQLKHMPIALKHYESKQYIVEPKNRYDQPKKIFEYVIQGLKKGDWQIPQQTFTYFDVDAYKYKTLKTAPLMVQIMEATNISTVPSDNEKQEVEEQPLPDVEDILPLNEQGPWQPIRERAALPLWIFILLMSAPLLFFIYSFIAVRIKEYQLKHRSEWRAHRAFKHALAQLKKAKYANNAAQIYYIMTQLFADRLHLLQASITQSTIEKKLKEHPEISSERLEQWQLFFNTITAHAFGHATQNDQQLFEQAKLWIDYLKEVL